ncbi:MAG: type II toxin-antitoxin system HicB family antitoxin [Bacteroidota bacterium]|nr:type II toxin-antitoxin system HicB family antitoxin [Bacteroidota bacterium]
MSNVLRKQKRTDSKFSQLDRFLDLPYKIELTPLSKKDGGGFLAVIPLLKGCMSDGKTPDEAIKNLREAQKAWFESSIHHNDSIPLPR